MSRSLRLAAYRALSRHTSDRRFVPSAPRRTGSLLWIHAAETESLLALESLTDRLIAARAQLNILITFPDMESFETAHSKWTPADNIYFERAPSDHPDAVAEFWHYWRPDMCVWLWGRLRPNLLVRTHAANCPTVVIDADEAGFDGRRDRWLPELSRELLDPCVAIMARSSAALQKMTALGLESSRIDLSPPLEAGGQALACNDSDLSDLTDTLRGRPVWLAGCIQSDELDAVAQAHRAAMRLSHRLLLILVTAKAGFDRQFKVALQNDGFRVADWSEGEEPSDGTQVLLSADINDLGLFYRIAPVTFMGGTLGKGHLGRNPFEAAALGSAVLYGPEVKWFSPFYSRLAKAGAARVVKDEKSLGIAVTRLIAPDQAAAMAHAGWDVISQGAAVTDRIVDLVQAGLDGDLRPRNAKS